MILTENLRTDFLVFITVLAVALISYLKWRHEYWQRRGVETITPSFLVGNIGDVLLQKCSFSEMLTHIYNEFKKRNLPYGGFYVFIKESFLVVDLDLLKSITTRDFQYFSDHGTYLDKESDPMSGHIFNLRGDEWKNLRVKLTPGFTPNKMKMFFPNVKHCAEELVNIVEKSTKNGEPLEIKDLTARYTTDCIGSSTVGIECNSLRNPDVEFRQYSKKVVEVNLMQAVKNLLAFTFPELLYFFKIPVTRKDVSWFFRKLVEDTIGYRETNGVVRKDLLHIFIQLKNDVSIEDDSNSFQRITVAKNQPSKGLTTQNISSHLFSFFIAGFETSMITTTFFLHELAFHQNVQEKLRDEIRAVLRKYDGEVCYDAIMEMAYLDQCLCEVLRIHSPTPTIMRRCVKPYSVEGTNLTLEEGTIVYIPMQAIHLDPEYYPDPVKFDPDRFSPENKAERNKLMWAPFGDGPRICLGLRFATMQIKTGVATLIQNFRFKPAPGTPAVLNLDSKRANTIPVGKVFLKVERVSSK